MGHWDTLSMRILPAYLAYDWLDNNNAGRSLVNEEFDMRVCPQQQLKHGKLKHLYLYEESCQKSKMAWWQWCWHYWSVDHINWILIINGQYRRGFCDTVTLTTIPVLNLWETLFNCFKTYLTSDEMHINFYWKFCAIPLVPFIDFLKPF